MHPELGLPKKCEISSREKPNSNRSRCGAEMRRSYVIEWPAASTFPDGLQLHPAGLWLNTKHNTHAHTSAGGIPVCSCLYQTWILNSPFLVFTNYTWLKLQKCWQWSCSQWHWLLSAVNCFRRCIDITNKIIIIIIDHKIRRHLKYTFLPNELIIFHLFQGSHLV